MASNNNSVLYKIVPTEAWTKDTENKATFAGYGIDFKDNFIHLSNREQVPGTAAKFFKDQHGLSLVAISTEHIKSVIKWEEAGANSGVFFPHVYGEIPLTSVLWVELFPIGENGMHVFPQKF